MRKRRPKDPHLCAHPDCRRVARGRGLCHRHYNYHMRHDTLHRFPARLERVANQPHDCDVHEPSRVCYQKHRCRCDDCRDAVRTYNRDTIARQALGRSPFVPAGPVRDYLQEQLQTTGLSLRRSAKQIGVPHTGLSDLVLGRVNKLRPETAQAILGWQPSVACRSCDDGTESYAGGRWCLDCLKKQRAQHAA